VITAQKIPSLESQCRSSIEGGACRDLPQPGAGPASSGGCSAKPFSCSTGEPSFRPRPGAAGAAARNEEVAEVIGTATIAALVRHRDRRLAVSVEHFSGVWRISGRYRDRSARAAVWRRSRSVLPAPAPSGPRCGGRATAGQWHRSSTPRHEMQDLRLDLRQCRHDVRVPSGRVQHGRDDAGGRAETPDGATAGSSDRTSGSANPRVAAGQQRKRCCAGASSRPAPAEHPPPARVSREASLSSVAPASGLSAGHVAAGHEDFSGWRWAAARTVRCHAWRAHGVTRIGCASRRPAPQSVNLVPQPPGKSPLSMCLVGFTMESSLRWHAHGLFRRG